MANNEDLQGSYQIKVTLKDLSEKNNDKEETKDEKFLHQYFASKVISPIINSQISYITSHVGVLTGSQDEQAQTDMSLRIFSNIQNIISGTFYGAVAKGIGGAVMGFTAGLLNVLQSYSQQRTEFALQKQISNIDIDILRARAGLNRSRF